MVRSAQEAAKTSLNTHTNKVGTCQLMVRTWLDAPSAGDFDHDGDADANDGWESEPKSNRHVGDRNPPAGVPLYFSGGQYGHRALSLGDGKVRSTDMEPTAYKAGVTSTTTIAEIEKHMNHKYVGWSSTIDGVKIPGLDNPKVKDTPKEKPHAIPTHQGPATTSMPSVTHGNNVTQSKKLLQKALDRANDRGDKARAEKLSKSLKDLPDH